MHILDTFSTFRTVDLVIITEVGACYKDDVMTFCDYFEDEQL
jgi:hypothetical protein